MLNTDPRTALKILIIEREPVIGSLVSELLHLPAQRITACRSVDDLIYDGLDTTQYSMIVVDLDTANGDDPTRTGAVLISDLKDDPDICELPVLAVSSHGNNSFIIAALNAGADDYVVKPVAPRELSARLTSIMRRR